MSAQHEEKQCLDNVACQLATSRGWYAINSLLNYWSLRSSHTFSSLHPPSVLSRHRSTSLKRVMPMVAVWRSGNALVSIKEVNIRRARLVGLLGRVTVSGFDSWRRHFISVCNQPPRSTQRSALRGTVKWVPAKEQWCFAAAEQCLVKVACGLVCR